MTPIRPMLAKPFHERHVADKGFIQPKLDGVRALWDGERLWSRTGKPILGMPKLIEELRATQNMHLDGELYAPGRSFQSFLGSIRKSVNVDEDESVQYHVYDAPIHGTFVERLHALADGFVETSRIRGVETLPVAMASEAELDVFTAQGFEGTMYRSAHGLYAFGKRSSDLLKIKTFVDAEFECVGVTERLTYTKQSVDEGTPGAKRYADGSWYKDVDPRGTGTTGALVCRVDGSDRTFEVGTGMDEATRAAFWAQPPIGKRITVKYQELTDGAASARNGASAGVPRFPVFVAVRDYE